MSTGKSWFERLLSKKDKDNRRAERKAGPPLIAHYWTGAAPAGQGIQDISATGLYLQTEQRWYPGTIVKIILQRTDGLEEDSKDSIAVQAKVVRMDSNGVGFAFVLEKTQPIRPGQSRLDVVADQKTLDEFLQRLHGSMDSLRLEVK